MLAKFLNKKINSKQDEINPITAILKINITTIKDSVSETNEK